MIPNRTRIPLGGILLAIVAGVVAACLLISHARARTPTSMVEFSQKLNMLDDLQRMAVKEKQHSRLLAGMRRRGSRRNFPIMEEDPSQQQTAPIEEQTVQSEQAQADEGQADAQDAPSTTKPAEPAAQAEAVVSLAEDVPPTAFPPEVALLAHWQ